MKILVFEYITGGGFNQEGLPDSLAAEGRLMLTALLENYRTLDHKLIVMLDSRLEDRIDTGRFNTVIIRPEHDCLAEFTQLTQQCDAVWPVAPEFGRLLETLCNTVEDAGKILLTSPASAVAVTADKFLTYQRLKEKAIPTVHTELCHENLAFETGGQEWIAKPRDGVGCMESHLFSDNKELTALKLKPGHTIIQPHIQGQKTSLSCLFKHGQAWLICVNLQQFDIIDKQYHLKAINVNIPAHKNYQPLADKIAAAFPDLWGYAGIDLIETALETYVLEINPRLTTSCTGLYAATGINLAESILQLLNGTPELKPTRNNTITTTLP